MEEEIEEVELINKNADHVEVLRELNVDERPQYIQLMATVLTNFTSPIDLNISQMIPLELPPLNWHNLDTVAKKMKLTNTGHTLLLNGTWKTDWPGISGGPLLEEYIFSQLHFHWGINDQEGSEHSVDMTKYPIEMHVTFRKSTYRTHEEALKERDGVCVIAYFFKLHCVGNPVVDMFTELMPDVTAPQSSLRIQVPMTLDKILNTFNGDYFVYWGSIETRSFMHVVLWIVCREPIALTIPQMYAFRNLLNPELKPILGNFREVQDVDNRYVFHVNRSKNLCSSLVPLPNHFDPNKKN